MLLAGMPAGELPGIEETPKNLLPKVIAWHGSRPRKTSPDAPLIAATIVPWHQP